MIAHAFVAFVVSSTSSTGDEILRWGSMPVAVDVHDADCTTTGGCVDAFNASLDVWEGVSGASISFTQGTFSGGYLAYDDAGGSDTSNGLNRIGSSPSSWPPGASSALGVTVVQGPGGIPAIDEADIYLNETYFDFDTGGAAGEFDVQGVITHEVGHLLGLGHTAVFSATMYYATGPGDTAPRTLETDDENGARFLYPSSGTYSCATSGECPTIVEAYDADETVIGSMGCTGGECCLVDVCGPGIGGGAGDPCDADADCQAPLHCPFDGAVCADCNDGEGGDFADCLDTGCAIGDCWVFEEDATCGTCLPGCGEQSECTGIGAHCLDADGEGTMRCVPDIVTGIVECDVTEPSACPIGQACTFADIGTGTDDIVTICFDQGTGDFGDDCDSADECATLLCVGSGASGTCATQCGAGWPDCPTGYLCDGVTIFGVAMEMCVPEEPAEGESEAESEAEAEAESEAEAEAEAEGESEAESEGAGDGGTGADGGDGRPTPGGGVPALDSGGCGCAVGARR